MKLLLATFFGLYFSVCGFLYFFQRSLLYFPETIYSSPNDSGLPEATEEKIKTADGETIIVWHIPPSDENKPVIVYFHGNGGSIYYRAGRFQMLAAQGFGIVGVSYRGYGGSSGSPSEQGLIEDARAAYEFTTKHYPATRIALWGESLGGGVAIALAAEKPVAKIVLESPFTSVADVASALYWFVPVRLLIKDPFRSDLRVEKITAPILVMQGALDNIVPPRFGQRLYEMIKGPKKIVRFPKGSHNDLSLHGALKEAAAFLSDPAK